MHPEDIKAAIRKKGMNLAALADELGVGGTAISNVVAGTCTSARIQARIVELTGISHEKLWPPRPAMRRKRKTAQPKTAAAKKG